MRYANSVYVAMHPSREDYAARFYTRQNGSLSMREFKAGTLAGVLEKVVTSPQYNDITNCSCRIVRKEASCDGRSLNERGYVGLSSEQYMIARELFRELEGDSLSSNANELLNKRIDKVMQEQDAWLNAGSTKKHNHNKSKSPARKK